MKKEKYENERLEYLISYYGLETVVKKLDEEQQEKLLQSLEAESKLSYGIGYRTGYIVGKTITTNKAYNEGIKEAMYNKTY